MITLILAFIAIMSVARATTAPKNEIPVENQLRKQWLSDMPTLAESNGGIWYGERCIEMVKNWKVVSDDPREHQTIGHRWYGFEIHAQNVQINTCMECEVIVGMPTNAEQI